MNDATPCPKCGSMLPADAPQGLCPRCLAALNFATETMPPEAAAMSHDAPLTPEELAPHFPQLEILECLGRGGMGVVYKARQKSLNRLVALKLLAPERAGDAKFAIHFAREAQALATLSHPHIVTIHDFGQAGGFYFLLMEFIDGVNLRQAMKAGRFTPDQALAIVPPVCEALQYAHEHGIVHRDIKPENLLLDKTGRVKIADFGIAKIIDLDEPAEASPEDSRTTMAGTPAYAAPEQQGGQADHRADIYSLGVVLYELLTGELPGKSLSPPSQRVQIDVRLDEIVLRALETQPELRYATAAEFRTQLETFTAVKGPAGRSTRWGRLLFIAMVILATVLGTMEFTQQSPANASPEPFGLSWKAFSFQILLLAIFISFVVWLVRRLLRSKRKGCLILLLVFISGLLVMTGAALVWYLSGPSTAVQPAAASSVEQKALSPEADSFWDWAGREIQKLEIEKARLRIQLGPKHPTILAIDAQIAELEKKRAEVATAPVRIDDDGLIRMAGTHRLNERYEVQLDVPVKGERPSNGEAPVVMRGYTLRSKADDGAAAVKTYVPLAMEGEPFIAFWDDAEQHLWLASPTVLSRHSLPVQGSPDHEMQFVTGLTTRLSQLRPPVVIEAMEAWIKTIAMLPPSAAPEMNPSKPQPDEKTLRDFLQKPQNVLGGRTTLFVTARRMHAFDDAIPDREAKEAIEIGAVSTRGLAFIPKGSPAAAKASKLLTWDQSMPCLITFRWQTDGKTRWLEVLDITEHASWTK